MFSIFAWTSWKQVMSKPKFYKKLELLWYKRIEIDWYEYFKWIKIAKDQAWINQK
jgi:hypothetical protein